MNAPQSPASAPVLRPRTSPMPPMQAAMPQPPYACRVQTGPDGRIAAKLEICGGSRVEWRYAYDKAGRLAEVVRDGVPVEAYTYDATGRRVTERNLLRGIEGRLYEYSDADGHLRSAGPLSLRHDIRAICNRIERRDGATDYEYANDGRLLKVARPDGVLVAYDHDDDGNRVAKYVNGRCVRKFVWDGHARLGAVYDVDHDLLVRFGYADGARLPYAMSAGRDTFFLLYDQVGSLRAVATAEGKVIEEIEYDTFGNILRETATDFEVPFGFAGGLHDRDTGLVRFGVRDYLPELGRFMAKDPLGLKGGAPDVYGYCLDDPVNRIDPTGLKSRQLASESPDEMTPDDFRRGMPYWTMTPQASACERCKERSGKKFREEPNPVHPNCKCKIEKHEPKLEARSKSGSLGGYESTDSTSFEGTGNITVSLSNWGIALFAGVLVTVNHCPSWYASVPVKKGASHTFSALKEYPVDWDVRFIITAAENTRVLYRVEYEVYVYEND
ncbi:MAG: RHS repeat domain-containing protein [Desulfovibrionaceae bacterium]